MIPQSAPSPSQPAPTGLVPQQKLPGRAGIWIGVALVVAGVVLGAVLVTSGARSFADRFEGLQRVPIDGGGTVLLESPGSQDVYLERLASSTGGGFTMGGAMSVPYIELRVLDPNGNNVYFDSNPDTAESYSFTGREGFLLGRFDAPVAGEYEIRVVPPDDVGPYTSIAVGEAIDVGGVLRMVGGVVGGGILVLLGIVVIIVSAVRRSRGRKRQQQASYGFPGSSGGSAGPPGWAPPPVAGAGGPVWTPPPAQTWSPPSASGWQPPPPPWTPPPPWIPPADPPPADAPPSDGEGPVQ